MNNEFRKYGEIPDDPPMKDKMMSYMGIQLNTLINESSSHIANILIQGNYMGMIECQKLLNHNPHAKPEVSKILKDFNQMQENNIETMKEFL